MLIKLIISFICIGMSLFLMERNADKGLKNLAEVSMRHKDAEKIKVGD